MPKISATAVKELRQETNISMMECKRALEETDGDKEAAIKILRERGLAIAGKKASRAANEGLIASALLDDGTAGSLIEVNCETDFVARNETFQAAVKDIATLGLSTGGDVEALPLAGVQVVVVFLADQRPGLIGVGHIEPDKVGHVRERERQGFVEIVRGRE